VSAIIQQVIVVVLVVAAALFAVWRLPGEATRLRWLVFLGQCLPESGRLSALMQRQIRLRRIAIGGSGCGTCGSKSVDR
jgi:hypothetical protein